MYDIVYKVRAYDTTATVSLVDRGDNGGIAGADVRVIEKLHRQVDVQGIDNHQMTNIQIVTAGGVTRTQRGEVILIMNQYAYVGKGTSIHSSPQMESYKTIVDDRSIKCGGRQLIQTLDGYVIPLSIKNSLPRMKLRPYTNKEWTDLPHVMLTSEEDWDPSTLDLDITDDEDWFDAISDNHEYMINSSFDEFGDYRKRVEVQQHSALSIEDSVDRCVLYHTNQLIVKCFNNDTPKDGGVIFMKTMMIASSL